MPRIDFHAHDDAPGSRRRRFEQLIDDATDDRDGDHSPPCFSTRPVELSPERIEALAEYLRRTE